MAQSRFKFDSASNYGVGTDIVSDAGTFTKLQVGSSVALNVKSSSPSPQNGSAYVYIDAATGPTVFFNQYYFFSQTTTNYLDFFYYDNRGGSVDCEILSSGQDWYDYANGYFGFFRQSLIVQTDGTIKVRGFYTYYNPDTGDSGGFDGQVATSSTGAIPQNAWCRIRVQVNTNYLSLIEIYKGSNILGTTPDVSVTGSVGSFPSSFDYPNYLAFFAGNTIGVGTGRFIAIDDLYISDTTWPTRATSSGPTAYGPSIRR